ncbi:uncharacterized protein LOC111035906 [Myzus persicae]|uniref:uncharacterized protein LOC111035906 n=1 Tax=Myzus persicae TaxID=13164 RepID=UPI000B933A2A|nr:uncharacterized protein LOC111035906 [Myzus persicae]
MANKKNALKRKRSTKSMVTKTLALRRSKKPSDVVEDRDPEESSVQIRFNNVDQNSSEPSTSIGSTNDIEIENIDFVTPIQFTLSPVQNVPIVECNQSFNLNDIESYTLPSVDEENSNTDVITDHLSGRRIVDVDYIFKQIQNSSHGGGLDCSFLNMSFVSEKRYGFFSKFKFQCKMCNIITVISSEPSDKSYLPINKALTFIAKKTNYPINLRQFILKNILRFRTAIVTAIRHRKNENVPTTQFFARPKALKCNLSADLFNSPYHIFGEHSKCDDYFCKKRLLEEENWVQRAEICEMMVEIKNIVNRLVINSASLILDLGKFSKLFLKDVARKRRNNARSRELFPSKNKKNNKKCSGPDENYGLADELVDDLTPAEFKIRKDNFLNELKTINREKLENETKDQSKSQLWYSERKKRITASNIGKICKMRQYTSCKKIVYDLLYSCINIKIKAIEYGRVMEIEAKKKFENIYNLKIAPVGLCVDEKILYLAASPDGLIGEDSIIEIKCPFSARNFSDIFDAIDAGKIPFCFKDKQNNVSLKTNHNYYYQIQTQLHVTKRKKCNFFIYTENWYYNVCITIDDNFWYQKIQSQIHLFYNECLLPELINPQFGKRHLVTDINDPPRILKEQAAKKK